VIKPVFTSFCCSDGKTVETVEGMFADVFGTSLKRAEARC
jgi:hypothetical protein